MRRKPSSAADCFATRPDDRRELDELPFEQIGLSRGGPEPAGNGDHAIRVRAVASRVQAFGEQVERRQNPADAGEHAAVGVCSYQEAIKLCLK